MKGSKEVIKNLNVALQGELVAIMQYILHSEVCERLGYLRLSKIFRADAMQEMHHAELLIERILFLEGTPEMILTGEIKSDKNWKKNFELDLKYEMDGIANYKAGIELCRKEKDDGTRQVLETILKDEEDHVDWLETQISLIDELGMENYLAEQMYGEDEE